MKPNETRTINQVTVTLSYRGVSQGIPEWWVYTGPYPGDKKLALRRIGYGRKGWAVCEFDRKFYTLWRPIESELTLAEAKERAVSLITL